MQKGTLNIPSQTLSASDDVAARAVGLGSAYIALLHRFQPNCAGNMWNFKDDYKMNGIRDIPRVPSPLDHCPVSVPWYDILCLHIHLPLRCRSWVVMQELIDDCVHNPHVFRIYVHVSVEQ